MKNPYRYLCKLLVVLGLGSSFYNWRVVGAQAQTTIRVGILQYVKHESLDATRMGFMDGLAEAGYQAGKNLEVNYLNANADHANLQSMAEKLVKQNDYLFAIATPAAQALANAADGEVPVYFSAVTDPVAAKLVDSLTTPGKPVTGTSDAGPLKQQIALLTSLQPHLEKVGILFNAGESNSVSEVNKAQSLFEAQAIQVVKQAITSTNEIQTAMSALVQKVDAIFLVTDNTVASSMDLVGDLALAAKLPLVGGSADMVETNGLATYGLDYYELGKQTAKMLISQIESGQSPETMPVQQALGLKLIVNTRVAKELGIDPSVISIPEQ